LVRQRLEEKRVKVSRVEPIRPSLEDVFVSLTTREQPKEAV
jgi:hypothetical protein